MNNAPGGIGPMPSYQGSYGQNDRGYNNPQGGVPVEQRDLRGDNRNYSPQQVQHMGKVVEIMGLEEILDRERGEIMGKEEVVGKF